MTKRITLSSQEAAKLVGGFLSRNPKAMRELPRDLGSSLHKMARKVAPDLAERGHVEDIVQETYLLLLTKPAGHFDPARGKKTNDPDRSPAGAYLGLLMRTAAQSVRAAHTPPGERTRAYYGAPDEIEKNRQEAAGPSHTAATVETGDEKKIYQTMAESLDKVLVDKTGDAGEDETSLHDLRPDPKGEESSKKMHLAYDIERAFGAIPPAAPAWLRETLELMYYEDMSITEAAAAIGQSRFSVRRAINRWVRPMPHLAA